MRSIWIALALLFAPAIAAACPSYPYTLMNGQTADANQVMANFNSVLACVNTGVANAPANTNITSISGLTTPLSVPQGGTGATTVVGAVSNLGGPFLIAANNFSDVPNISLAVSHLGGPFLVASNNLSDVTSASTALSHLGGAPLASPVFSGVPTAPTAPGGTNTTQLATTQFVQSAVTGGAITYAVFTDQQTSGTASGESLSGTTWNQRTLNTTIVNTIAGASLGSNQITLPAGTYSYQISAVAYGTSATGGVHVVRLRNVTASSTISVSGQALLTDSAAFNLLATPAVISGVFVLTGSTVLEVDHYPTHAASGGAAVSSGEAEVYVSAAFEKIG